MAWQKTLQPGETVLHRARPSRWGLGIAGPIEFKSAILAAADEVRNGRARHAAAPVSGADRLRDLKRLLDEGLINEAEFAKKRAELVDAL